MISGMICSYDGFTHSKKVYLKRKKHLNREIKKVEKREIKKVEKRENTFYSKYK